jgi:putative transposase
MLVNQGYRYELKPNNVQRTLLAKSVGVARSAFNWALERRIELLENEEGKKRFSNAMADHRLWNVWKREHAPWALEVSKCAPQEAFRDLDNALRNYWQGRKEGRPVGFPKFRKKGERDSCRFSTGAIKALGTHVQLPRLGKIRVKEPTAVKGRILSATISREADRWFVSFTVERHRPDPEPVIGPVVGIDLGIESFAVLSDGERVESPRPLRRSMKRLQRSQKKHSRKQKGSVNRRKSALRLARRHRRVRNQRRDFLHKLTTRLARTKSVIVIEDLGVKGMSATARGTRQRPGKKVRAKSGLNRSILDQGWGMFRRMLEYKTQWYGSTLVIAPRFLASSRTCSACGEKLARLPLSTRAWVCPACRASHQRDLNAALNLSRLATTASSAGSYACLWAEWPMETPLAAERTMSGLRVTGR